MRWRVHGERSIYDSEWASLRLVDVELPDGRRFEHHVVRVPRPAVGTVVHDPRRGILLLRRHRFITDTWGWEIPAGRVDEGEDPATAAAREVLEETGWRPGPVRHLVSYHPSNGLSDQRFEVYVADGAVRVGPPTDTTEASEVRWWPTGDVRRLIATGAVVDGLSLTGLATFLALGPG